MRNFVKCGILLLMILLSTCIFTACQCEHEFQETVIKEATCGQDGQKELACTKCDEVQTEVIPATGEHRYTVAITKKATCAAEGTETKTCSVCNDVVTKAIPKTTNHNYSSKIIKEATCAEEGTKTKTCNICKDVKTEVIPKSGIHSYTDKIIKEATCNKEGTVERTCTVCETQKTESIPKNDNHSTKLGKCSVCGKNVTTLMPTAEKINEKFNLGLDELLNCLATIDAALDSPKLSGASGAFFDYAKANAYFDEAYELCGNHKEFKAIKSDLKFMINKISDGTFEDNTSVPINTESLFAIVHAMDDMVPYIKDIENMLGEWGL